MKLSILIPLVLVMLFAFSNTAIAQNDTGLPTSINIDIVNQHKVFFDYSAKVTESVQISGNTYYVAEYKNMIPFANGIIIIDTSGEIVEDETVISGVIEAVTWIRTLDELSVDELTELGSALQTQATLGSSSQALVGITNELIAEKSKLEARTIDSNAATRINTQLTQINTEITTLHASTEESMKSLEKTSKKISNIYGDVDKRRNQLNRDLQSRQHAIGSIVLGMLSTLLILIASLFLIRKISSLTPKSKGAKHKEFGLPALGNLFSKKKGIVGQLYSHDPQERARAALMMGFSTEVGDDAIMGLIPLVNDEDVRVRANATQTLYKLGQKNPAYVEMAAAELQVAMSDEDEMVRKNAADAYSLIGDIESQRTERAAYVPETMGVKPVTENITEHVVEAIPKSIPDTTPDPMQFEQPQRTHQRRADVTGMPESCSVSLRIVSKGRPLSNARIVLTDEAGRVYEIQTSNIGVATASVPVGAYSCLIRHELRSMTKHIDVVENGSFIFQFENHVNIIITDKATGMPLEGVNVEIRSEDSSIHESVVSNDAGVTSFNDFDADRILVSVQHEGYESVQATYTDRDIPISIHKEARHEPQSATISDEMIHAISSLRSGVSRYTDNLPYSCDLCVPQYLQNICIASLDIAQHATSDNEQFIKAATLLCEGIQQSMQEGRLADICIGKNTGGFDAKSCEVHVENYLSKLGTISEHSHSDVERRLYDVDSLITKNMSYINIIPVVGVWKIAKILIDASNSESQPHAFLFFADLVLDRVVDMMENPEIAKRLAQ